MCIVKYGSAGGHISKNTRRSIQEQKQMSELFSMNSTLNEILNNERVNKKLHYLFSPDYYGSIRPMFRKMKLKHMIKLVKTPWGSPFPAQGLLRCANFLIERREKGEMTSIPIWKDLPPGQAESAQNVVLIPFLINRDSQKMGDKKAPCVIICPGGGLYPGGQS